MVYGHLMRMPPTRAAKRVIEFKLPGRRLRGRLRKRWQDEVKEFLERENTALGRAEVLCKDRKTWRGLVHGISAERPSEEWGGGYGAITCNKHLFRIVMGNNNNSDIKQLCTSLRWVYFLLLQKSRHSVAQVTRVGDTSRLPDLVLLPTVRQ